MIPEDRCFKDGASADDVSAHGVCLARATEEACYNLDVSGIPDGEGCVWRTVMDASAPA